MAAIEFSRPAVHGLSVGGRIINTVQKLGFAYLTWREAQQTARELNALSDHELADIGITRWDIAQIANPTR